VFIHGKESGKFSKWLDEFIRVAKSHEVTPFEGIKWEWLQSTMIEDYKKGYSPKNSIEL
jgi:hypothetical protein